MPNVKKTHPLYTSRVDPKEYWKHLQAEAREAAQREPILAAFLEKHILSKTTLHAGLAMILTQCLQLNLTNTGIWEVMFQDIFENPDMMRRILLDIDAVQERDPAANGLISVCLYFKGFHALLAYRVMHELWRHNRYDVALFLQSRASLVLGVDIHPGAKIGSGIFIDHATGVVIGETAVVGDDVSLLHEVTLGGTGKESGDRHPKIGRGVLIGTGAKVLGNISIGEGTKVAAGSVVLHNVPAYVTVAGIPAKIVGLSKSLSPGKSMDHSWDWNYNI